MKNFVVFALGAVCGALAVKGYEMYKLRKEMMTTDQGIDISDDPVDSVDESYPIEEESERLEKKAEEEMNKTIIHDNGYSSEDEIEEDEDEDIHEIRPKDYGYDERTDTAYQTFEWSFWDDDIMTGEDDSVLGSVEVINTIGQRAVDKLRSGKIYEIYIRNEPGLCDYHIVRESTTWTDRYKVKA